MEAEPKSIGTVDIFIKPDFVQHLLYSFRNDQMFTVISASSLGKPQVNHYAPSMYPASSKSCATRQIANNIPTQKKTEQKSHKKAGIQLNIKVLINI